MDKNRQEKIRKLEKLYKEFEEHSFPDFPSDFLFFGDFVEWDAVIAGIASSYIKGTEKEISAPLSVKEMLNNFEKEMRGEEGDCLNYKPPSDEDAKKFNEFLVYKNKLYEMVKFLKEITEMDN